MRFLLRLRHWQLFLITWGVPLIMNAYAFSDPILMLRIFPYVMLLFTVGTFGWMWAIGTEAHKRLPADVSMNLTMFRIFLIVPVLYILVIILAMQTEVFFGNEGEGMSAGLTIVPVLLVVHLLSMVFIFLALRFAAKALKSAELGRLAKFGDYAGEFFMIWFSIIGMWVLQPKLNKMVKH
jgi:hypothetical protein